MGLKKHRNKDGLFKGVLMAYTVLLLHVTLVAALGFLVFFFRGIVQYMGWIMAGGLIAVCASGYYFYRRMKTEGKNLREMLRMPLLAGKSVEVSVLGGLASFRVGDPGGGRQRIDAGQRAYPLLENPESDHVRELESLVRLFESGLITQDEYHRAKEKLLNL